jgi:hypothetical protein
MRDSSSEVVYPSSATRGISVIQRSLASPSIGQYMGRPIFESIEVQDEAYIFDRIAQYVDDGYPLDQLKSDEVLVEPGLIYRHK